MRRDTGTGFNRRRERKGNLSARRVDNKHQNFPLAMNAAQRQQWLHIPSPLDRPKLRLICFPYAGASGVLYHPWARLLPAGVELSAVLMPGRLGRRDEPPMLRMEPLIEALAAC